MKYNMTIKNTDSVAYIVRGKCTTLRNHLYRRVDRNMLCETVIRTSMANNTVRPNVLEFESNITYLI